MVEVGCSTKCGFFEDGDDDDGLYILLPLLGGADVDGFFTRRWTFVSGLGSLPLLLRLPLLTLFESVFFRDRELLLLLVLFRMVTAAAKGSKSTVGDIKNPSSSTNDASAAELFFITAGLDLESVDADLDG